MKKCKNPECHCPWQPEENFYNYNASRGGSFTKCKTCVREQEKKRRADRKKKGLKTRNILPYKKPLIIPLPPHLRKCPKGHHKNNKSVCEVCRKERGEKKRREGKLFIYKHLATNPCVDCGETDILLLQFDHLRDKEYGVSEMHHFSIEKIKEEIDKCEVRCYRCHRIKTMERMGKYEETMALIEEALRITSSPFSILQ